MTTLALSRPRQSLENYPATVAIKDNIHLIRLSPHWLDVGSASVAIPSTQYGDASPLATCQSATFNRPASGYRGRAMVAPCCR
jgi:hypothetical protein